MALPTVQGVALPQPMPALEGGAVQPAASANDTMDGL
jgi:hypothetical protein